MKTKSPLPYYGSDASVAAGIAELLNHCKHVTIPFCGGMSILPHLTAKAIVANDMNALAINFYRVASGLFGEFAKQDLFRRCEITLSHPDEMDKASQLIASEFVTERAWAYWALAWIGRKGKGGTKDMKGKPSVRRKADGGNNATRISAAASDLAEWAQHFKRCEWEQRDFREVLKNVADDKDCGVYCDPPWVGAGDLYDHPFTENDHISLSMWLGSFDKTSVVVRYGDDPLIRSLYPEGEGWEWIEATSRTQANTVRGEYWIVN